MKTETIKLADGNDYKLSPLNMGDLIEIEEKLGSIEVNMNNIKSIAFWLWLSLKKENKDLTLENSYKLIDMPFIVDGNMESVIKAILKLNGMDKVSKNVESPVKEKKQA